MHPLSEPIIAILSVFAPMFSKPVWSHVQVLLTGALLCQGPHTVAAILRVMGLEGQRTFCKYHRVLSRDKWSGLQGAQILLGLLVVLAVKSGVPVMIAVDETIERRKGKKIKANASTSSAQDSGHRKTTVDWTIQAVKVTSRWLQYAAWTLVGDGAYACIALAHSCNANNVTLISRLRLDARLFDFPEEQPASKRGPKPKKGKRQPRLSELAADPNQSWQEVDIAWYGGEVKRRKILSGVCLWHTNGQDPVKIRWVLVVDPEGKDKPEAFFTTDENLAPERIVEIFVLRWNIEVTFEEVRRHLGVETQRQWSDLAIARTTPALMGLFSLVCLIALQILKDGSLPLRHAAWYRKQDAAFSDVLAFVRRAIWAGKYLHNSVPGADRLELSRDEMDTLLDRLAATA